MNYRILSLIAAQPGYRVADTLAPEGATFDDQFSIGPVVAWATVRYQDTVGENDAVEPVWLREGSLTVACTQYSTDVVILTPGELPRVSRSVDPKSLKTDAVASVEVPRRYVGREVRR